MMTFDTHAAVKGFDEAQAEVLTDTISRCGEANHEKMATKGDVTLLRNDISALEIRPIKWMLTVNLSTGALIIAAIKLL